MSEFGFAWRLHFEYCIEFGIEYRHLSNQPDHVCVWWQHVALRILVTRPIARYDGAALFRAWSHDLYVKAWLDQPECVRETWMRIAARMSYARERGKDER
jgi:hypothetical protein